eukprot:TRINITY_DN14229_c0_g1_i1.p4 TRINITY_DN14229_c0_g1~~TRINITY_DN14229_c0_g1_i1.p4  ORF type:complete len:119 (-),score=52.93 TRINITY_DN14229_c0_g1_i1:304-660(-)
MSVSEMACTYAALILHDDDLEITADQITELCKAANVTIEPYWPALFAKFFERQNIGDLIASVGTGGGGGGGGMAVAAGGGGGAAAAGGGAEAAPKEEAKKEESEEEESDDDMGFSLFD